MPPFDEGIGGPDGWLLVDEPELHLGPEGHREIVVPDVAGWRRERMPKLPDAAWFPTVPDWTCEFISPRSKKRDRETKHGIYASFGVEYYWRGDAMQYTLETFALKCGLWERTGLFRQEDQVAAPPFAEVPFSLARLWPD